MSESSLTLRSLKRNWRSLALDAFIWTVMVFILSPLVVITWLAFFKQEIPTFPPEGYTLRWFWAILDNQPFMNGLTLSAKVAAVATAIGLLLGVPAALGVARSRFRGLGASNALLLLPLVVPGVVLGTSIYVAQVEAEIAASGAGLDWRFLGTVTGLIAGHALVVIPWIVRLVTASLANFDRAVEEAAQSLGANPFVTFYRVTLPGIRPGIVAGALFGFVWSFGNLEMTLFLLGPGQTTIPIAILQYLEWKIDPTVAAVSVVQILFIGAAMLITNRYVKLAQVV